jgi:hypothetical protein
MSRAQVGPSGEPGRRAIPAPNSIAPQSDAADPSSMFHTGIWSGYVRRYLDGEFFEATQGTVD